MVAPPATEGASCVRYAMRVVSPGTRTPAPRRRRPPIASSSVDCAGDRAGYSSPSSVDCGAARRAGGHAAPARHPERGGLTDIARAQTGGFMRSKLEASRDRVRGSIP